MYGIPGMRSAVLPVRASCELSHVRAMLIFRNRPAFRACCAVILNGSGGYLHAW